MKTFYYILKLFARLNELLAAKLNMTRSHLPQKPVKDKHLKPLPKQSLNNCGIHTVFRILTTHNADLHEKFSTNAIEKKSTAIRAWLYSCLITPLTRQTWAQSWQDFTTTVPNGKWFNHNAKITVEKSQALLTLLPDQLLSGDAIQLSLSKHSTITHRKTNTYLIAYYRKEKEKLDQTAYGRHYREP